MKKLNRYYNTIKYLKLVQLYYQLKYRIFKIVFKFFEFKGKISTDLNIELIKHIEEISISGHFVNFKFLNKCKQFKIGEIEWNFSKFGKLWTYNLNYFEFLNNDEITKNKRLLLVWDYINNLKRAKIKDGLEPYPISLRTINWIKFIIHYDIQEADINNFLYSQYILLFKRIEYHLQGNHLLENGFSLLWGAYYFQDKKFLNKAIRIIKSQLKEQILSDGAHFELSPMYHRILIHRILDCYKIVKDNKKYFNLVKLEKTLNQTAAKMFDWLNSISYRDGSQPNFGDSITSVFIKKDQLVNYGNRLGINTNSTIELTESGYRRIVKKNYELFIDVGQIGPHYQPGHSHSDTFNFELKINSIPIIVDTGISTYEKNYTRYVERSTESHNTVKYGDIEQSDVWGGFRVGKRANIINLIENKNFISASHNGYKAQSIEHQRIFKTNNNSIIIVDNISGRIKYNSHAYFHFHPDLNKLISINGDTVIFNKTEFVFSGNQDIDKYMYYFAENYNLKRKAICIRISFWDKLLTKISIKD